MVFIENGAAVLTQATADKITGARYGQSDILESYNDVGLNSPIIASQKTISKTVATGSILIVHDLLSIDANSTTLQEFELNNGVGIPLTRKTTTALVKNSNKEVTTTQIVYVDFN